MKLNLSTIKIAVIVVFTGFTFLIFMAGSKFTPTSEASSGGPPSSRTGAPGETTCTACHSANSGSGQFNITAPANYTPGQTYTIQLTHSTTDTSRASWGFELTSLTAANANAGTFANTTANTKLKTATSNGRNFIEQTLAGDFSGQIGGANWTFTWTAPATDVGPVTFYAAGLQADDDGGTGGDETYLKTAVIQPATVAAVPHVFSDFDGDGKADYAIYRPSTGQWYIQRPSREVSIFEWGTSGDVPVAGDFDSDGKADLSVFRPSDGSWYTYRSGGGVSITNWGISSDLLVPADYDGDGKADIAVFRPSTGQWFILRSSDSSVNIVNWGISGDKPVVGDYDGDGKADIAQFRPSDGNWYILKSTNGGVRIGNWGTSTDITVPGDYDGDGKMDVAIFRPSTGAWYAYCSTGAVMVVGLGTAGDKPVPADYDGDGKTDMAVFRPSDGNWYVARSLDSTVTAVQWGVDNDVPVQSPSVR